MVDSRWIFSSPLDNGKIQNISAVRKQLQLILDRADFKKIQFHDLRHTYATMIIQMKSEIAEEKARRNTVKNYTAVNKEKANKKAGCIKSNRLNILGARQLVYIRIFLL